ncbi:hypothetical protein E4N80_08795 [Treponema denticola]|uniref:hypothetical protein n=1 Tax=Treponema denticola TaxID=158 RepID=UPI0020A51EAF|nr:hypothetical protein [Treponema denticola]UTD05571.1 hypothetical protein E4N80_08795 [Treponema denticola]
MINIKDFWNAVLKKMPYKTMNISELCSLYKIEKAAGVQYTDNGIFRIGIEIGNKWNKHF